MEQPGLSVQLLCSMKTSDLSNISMLPVHILKGLLDNLGRGARDEFPIDVGSNSQN